MPPNRMPDFEDEWSLLENIDENDSVVQQSITQYNYYLQSPNKDSMS